jgi:hypothetical protein
MVDRTVSLRRGGSAERVDMPDERRELRAILEAIAVVVVVASELAERPTLRLSDKFPRITKLR